jgi:RimJ/RimL family protein N-acetyltransferase
MDDRVSLRDVEDGDLEQLFEHQREPEANRMAAFPPRDRDAFFAHWARTRVNPSNIMQAVIVDGQVAGNMMSWEHDGRRLVGYWIGSAYWGRGIATRALVLFLRQLTDRPLHAHVAVGNVGSIRVLEKAGFRHVPTPDAPLPEDGVEEYLYVLEE